MSTENMRKPVPEIVRNDGNNRVSPARAEQTEDEIDLIDLGYALLDKLHFIVMFFLLGAVVFNAYAYFMISPTYESTAKLYVVSASEDSVVNLSDLNIGTSLTKDYEDLMLSYPVLDQVIDKLNLNMDSETLADMISLTNPDDTRVLRVTVTSTDPEQAKDIANTLTEIAVEYLPETMSTNAPNIAQVARTPDTKAGPSYAKWTLFGALLAAFLYCAFVVARYLLDDTVHTPADMEKYFGIVPLTSVPDIEIVRQGQNRESGRTGKLSRKEKRT